MKMRALPFGSVGLSAASIHGTGLAIKLLFTVALVRWSSPQVVGTFGLLAAIDMVVIYCAGFEFHTFTARRYASRPSDARLGMCVACHRSLMRVTVPLAILLSLLAGTALRIDLEFSGFVALALLCASGVIVQEVLRLLVLTSRPVAAVSLGLVRTAAWQPFAIPILFRTGRPADGIAMIWAASSVLAACWGVWQFRQLLGRRIKPRLKYLAAGMTASLRYYVTGAAGVIYGHVDRFVLQLLIGPGAVGVITFYQTLANTIPAFVQVAVLNVGFPQLLQEFGQRNRNRFAHLKAMCNRCVIVSLLIGALILACAWPLLQVLSRGAYSKYIWILPAFMIGQVALMWSQPLHLALYASRRDSLLMFITLGGLASSIVLNLTLVSLLGIPGSALAAVVSACALAALRWGYLRQMRAAGQ